MAGREEKGEQTVADLCANEQAFDKKVSDVFESSGKTSPGSEGEEEPELQRERRPHSCTSLL